MFVCVCDVCVCVCVRACVHVRERGGEGGEGGEGREGGRKKEREREERESERERLYIPKRTCFHNYKVITSIIDYHPPTINPKLSPNAGAVHTSPSPKRNPLTQFSQF